MAFRERLLEPRFARFVVVGGGCYLLGLALLYVSTGWLGVHYLVSMAVAMVVVNLAGWYLNRRWTFGMTNRQPVIELGKYFLVNGISFVATLGVMFILVSGIGINYLVASAITAVLMLLVNFVVHRAWTFAIGG